MTALIQIEDPRQPPPAHDYPRPIGQRIFGQHGAEAPRASDHIRATDLWLIDGEGDTEDEALAIMPGGAWTRVDRAVVDVVRALDGHTLETAAARLDMTPAEIEALLEAPRDWGLVSLPGKPAERASPMTWSEDFGLLVLKLTNVCNIDCEYCYNGGVNDGAPLTLDRGKHIVREALDHAPVGLNLVFHGGEPFVERALIDELCTFARAHAEATGKQVFFNVQTNATLLGDAALDVIDRHGIGVGVSLDGPGALNALRIDHGGKQTTHKVWRGIDRLMARGHAINIITVITRNNADHLLDIVLAFQERGITSVKFSPFLGQGYGEGSADRMAPDPAAIVRGYRQIIDAIGDGRVHAIKVIDLCDMIKRCLSWGEPTMCHRGGPCGAGRDMLAIYPQGEVYACDCLVDDRFQIGTIGDGQTLAEMAAHPIIETLGDRSPAAMQPCGACALQRHCGGTMTCRAYWSTGDEARADAGECHVNQHTLVDLMWALTAGERLVRYFFYWERRDGESLAA